MCSNLTPVGRHAMYVAFAAILAVHACAEPTTTGPNSDARASSHSEAFRPLGPPAREELDKLFPPPNAKATPASPRKRGTQKDTGDASDLLIQMLQSPDPVIRVRAVEGLMGDAAKDAVPLLLIALADSDAEVRAAAGRSLASVPQEAVMDSVVGVLGWGDPVIAETVDAELPALRDALETPMLARFESKETPRVERMAAAYCLGRMASRRAGTALAGEIWGDDLALAMYCANALASIEAPDLVEEFVRMAAHPRVEMRVAAYRGLARIGGDDARAALLEAASGRAEPDSSARKIAIRLLAYVPDDEVVEFLMDQVRASAGLVGPSTDALAAMFAMPYGLARERWLEWYQEIWAPAKAAGNPPGTARASVDPNSGVPVGFPEEGFPFTP